MKKNTQKKQEARLLKDLKKLIQHWKKILDSKKVIKNKELLHQMAKDIQDLYTDTENLPDLYPASYLIHHFLISPYGAAFMTNRSLLDAALAFESQTAEESDLSQLLEGPQKKELPMIFWSLYEIIKKEKK